MNAPAPGISDETRYGKFVDLLILKRFFSYARPYSRWIVVAFCLLPLAAFTQLTQPLMIRFSVDNHISTGDMDGFIIVILGYGALVVLQLAVSYVQTLLHNILGQRIVRDLRRDLFSHVVNQDTSFFHTNTSGRLTNRLTNDTESVNQMISAGLINLVGDILLLIGVAVSMFALSMHLSLITLATMPFIVVATVMITSRVRKAQKKARVMQADMSSMMTEELEGIDVVRLFNRQKHNHQAFDAINSRYYHSTVGSTFLETVQFSFVETTSTAVLALLFWYGASLQESDPVTLGTLIAFIDYIRRLFNPIRDLSSKFTTMQAAMTALERIFSLIDQKPKLNRSDFIGDKTISNQTPPSIKFENISFNYGKGDVLKEINLEIEPGERIAVVGPTGTGKTSLIKLLNRTYDPVQGRVLIDGQDIRTQPLSEVRRSVGMIQQETFLFTGSVAENLSLGDSEMSREQMKNMLKQAQAWPFIKGLPDQLDAKVEQRGYNFSTGQRQLLGFARVLASQPRILVMDEATSSVDTVSERLIQEALQVLLKGRTALIIAHRLSTIREADRIVVLSNGKIEEIGTHEALLQRDGLYAKLYALQFQDDLISGDVAASV
ncbi:MAG: ABC transporter ATP-binding protein [Magnetococcales bacterium]|nr:ABC transporter ATP-binding protein [Magnetococcales bacterium]